MQEHYRCIRIGFFLDVYIYIRLENLSIEKKTAVTPNTNSITFKFVHRYIFHKILCLVKVTGGERGGVKENHIFRLVLNGVCFPGGLDWNRDRFDIHEIITLVPSK